MRKTATDPAYSILWRRVNSRRCYQNKLLMERDEAKVQEELYTLARNNAAAIGATNLVQHGMPRNGEQSFTAYRCHEVG